MSLKRKILFSCVIGSLILGFNFSAGMASKSILTVALDGEPTHLDPTCPAEDLVEYASSQQIFDNLLSYSYDGKMRVEPSIISEWKWENPTSLWIKIRSDIKFHNGKKLTMEDVKYTVERIKDPKTGSKIASYLDAVDKVEIIDPYTGRFRLKYPYAPLITYVLEKVYVVPEGSGDELKTHPIGSGPFKFKDWMMGEKVVLVRNEGYWKGVPKLETLEFRFCPNYQTALNGLLAGDIDIILWLNNADADWLKKKKEIRVEEKALYGCFYVGFNVEKYPWNDLRVRQAVKYGVDKKLVLDTAQLGYGSTVDVNEIPPSPFYTPDFSYERDVEKAKSLLKEAGLYGKIEDNLIIPLTPTEGPIGEAVAASLNEIGMNIHPVKLKVPEFIDQVFIRKDYPTMICGYAGVPDPDFWDYTYLHTKGSTNVFHYSNSTMDKYLRMGRESTSLEDRKEAYYNVLRMTSEDIPIVWLINEYRFTAIRDCVKGFKWNKSKIYDYRDVVIEE